MQYTQDYDENYPLAGREGNAPITSDGWWWQPWVQDIQPYVKSIQVFRCPSDSGGSSSEPEWGPAISYACNAYLRDDRGTVGLFASRFNLPVRSLASVTNPAQTIAVTDKHSSRQQSSGGIWFGRNSSNFWPTSMLQSDGVNGQYNAWLLDRIPNGAVSGAFPNGPEGAVFGEHFEMANFLFADGHVKAMRPVATNPNGTTRPQDNMWDALR